MHRRSLLPYCVVAFLLFCFPLPALAAPIAWSNRCADGDVAKIQGLECVFANVASVLVPLAGLALFVVFIVGSWQLLTSGGDAKAVQKSRQTLTYAVVGLVLLLTVWFILNLIKTITGVDVTIFRIPG